MKKGYKLIALFLAAIFCTMMISQASATATNGPLAADELQIEQTVASYLDAYLKKAYLYEDANFAAYSVSTQLMSSGNALLTVNGKSITVREAEKNMVYRENKAEYFRVARQAQGIYRSDFNVKYFFNSTEVSSNHAAVNVSAIISFKYHDHDDISILEELFNVALVKINGIWLIADVVEPRDWFDASYKDDPSFDFAQYTQDCVKALMAEVDAAETMPAPEALPAAEGLDTVSPLSTGTSLSYNRNNAVAYAYTYTTSTTSDPLDFYNGNFQHFSSDCMNFVSQCVWAGFGGNNNTTSVDNHAAPMDVSGQYAYNWFSSSPNNVNQHSASWSACGHFRTYLARPDSDPGLRADTYDIGT